MPPRRVFLAGGHISQFLGKGHPDFIWKKHPDFGKRTNPGIKEYLVEAVRGALAATGVEAKSLDRVYVANFAGELFNSQGHLGAGIAGADPALLYKPSMRIEGACASGGLACAEAVRAIRAGDDAVMVAGVEVQTEANARDGAGYLARAADFKRQRAPEANLDEFTFPCMFARRAKHYLDKYPGASMEDIGLVAAKAYEAANKNPLAHMHKVKIPKEQATTVCDKNPVFLGNETWKPFLRLSDCSQVSDGGAAAVFVSEEGLQKYGISRDQCTEVMDADYGCGDLWSDADDLSEMATTRAVVQRLLEKNGLKASDINVAEVHDCFALTELLMYEAIGLCARGEGGALLRSGATTLGGACPVNTGGGLLAFGHPVGATGVKQLLEVHRQMKGQCGDYQMQKRPEIGLTVNMGGDDKTCAAHLLRA